MVTTNQVADGLVTYGLAHVQLPLREDGTRNLTRRDFELHIPL